MNLQIDFWQLVGFGATLLSGFAAVIFGAGKLIAGQFERRIDERFAALAKQREAEGRSVSDMEREFLIFKAELALHYVRREDFIQAISGINTRIDNFALRVERALDNLNHKGKAE